MATPARKPASPSEPLRQDLPEKALTPKQARAFEQRSPVDSEAAMAWLMGDGPDPWRDESGSA